MVRGPFSKMERGGGGVPPCFCLSVGNTVVAGEWAGSVEMIGVMGYFRLAGRGGVARGYGTIVPPKLRAQGSTGFIKCQLLISEYSIRTDSKKNRTLTKYKDATPGLEHVTFWCV